MGGSKKSKKITWASDVNLCQIRLFLSEESPSQVGVGTQDHLQAKTPWSVQQGGIMSDENLPPGFEGLQPANLWRNKLSQLPLIKWIYPPRFEVDGAWRVVAGQESTEVEAQNQREMRVLEAIYPRPSAIPPNPALNVENSLQNDQNTPKIPITSTEDEDTAPDERPQTYTEPNTVPMTSQPLLAPGTSSSQVSGSINPHAFSIPTTGGDPHVQPDIVAAARAAMTAAMSQNDQGNLIDSNLLIRILSDPNMIEQLVKSRGTTSVTQNLPASNTQNMPASTLQSMPSTGVQNLPFSSSPSMPSTSMHSLPSSSTLNLPYPRSVAPSLADPSSITINRRDPPSAHITRAEFVASPAMPSRPFFPPSRIGPIPNLRSSVRDTISVPPPSVGVPVTKDINYYKSLIQQHGGERPEVLPQYVSQSNQHLGTNHEPLNFAKSKSKIMRPCMYFNSSRGCRNGANCAYLHDASSQRRVSSIPEVQSAKRMKMDSEITGT